MTWEEKIVAMQALGDLCLRMREPGDWLVSHYCVAKFDGHSLTGGCATDAKTPQDAVERHWEWLVSDVDGDCIRSRGRDLRWNGFMWEEAKESCAS